MKYAEFRKIKALDLKRSIDNKKAVTVKHYAEPIFHIVSKSEYERLTKENNK